jgi:hypothetical protein
MAIATAIAAMKKEIFIMTYIFAFYNNSDQEEEMAAVPEGYSTTRDEATKDYIFQQTMLRVKDPKVSLDFYSRVLGMRCAFFLHYHQSFLHLFALRSSLCSPSHLRQAVPC